MKHKDIIILRKIRDYCSQCEEAVTMFDNDLEKFKTVSVFQNSCCMCILQIGELCKVVSDELIEEVPDIPWKQWCGIRDIFAHQYSNIDYESAWDTIQEDVPAMKVKAEELLSVQPAETAQNKVKE